MDEKMKMFVSDLDGTVLMQGETRIKKRFLNMITELDQCNKKFVVASGRSYSALKKFFSHHLLQMYFLCENGALIQYQGKTLYKKEMKRDIVTDILGEMELLGCEWVISGVHTIYTGNRCGEIAKIYKELEIPVMKVESLRDIPESMIRISVLHTDTKKREAVRMAAEELDENVKVTYEDDTWTDIMNHEADKAVALQWLMNQERVRREEVAVFGDNINDIGMLRVVPNSYAMRWAPESVKDVANYTTECVMESITQML